MVCERCGCLQVRADQMHPPTLPNFTEHIRKPSWSPRPWQHTHWRQPPGWMQTCASKDGREAGARCRTHAAARRGWCDGGTPCPLGLWKTALSPAQRHFCTTWLRPGSVCAVFSFHPQLASCNGDTPTCMQPLIEVVAVC